MCSLVAIYYHHTALSPENTLPRGRAATISSIAVPQSCFAPLAPRYMKRLGSFTPHAKGVLVASLLLEYLLPSIRVHALRTRRNYQRWYFWSDWPPQYCRSCDLPQSRYNLPSNICAATSIPPAPSLMRSGCPSCGALATNTYTIFTPQQCARFKIPSPSVGIMLVLSLRAQCCCDGIVVTTLANNDEPFRRSSRRCQVQHRLRRVRAAQHHYHDHQ